MRNEITVSSENNPKRVTNAYDVEEVQPPTPSVDTDTEVPSDDHTGETRTEGLDKMMDDLSNLDDTEPSDEPVSASEDTEWLVPLEDDSEDEETADLEYDPEWIAVQLAKLDMARLARRALEGRMDETEIEEVALQAIYSNKFDASAELDLQPTEPGSVELVPAPVDEEEVADLRERLTTV